jgi:hypothetical protein
MRHFRFRFGFGFRLGLGRGRASGYYREFDGPRGGCQDVVNLVNDNRGTVLRLG